MKTIITVIKHDNKMVRVGDSVAALLKKIKPVVNQKFPEDVKRKLKK